MGITVLLVRNNFNSVVTCNNRFQKSVNNLIWWATVGLFCSCHNVLFSSQLVHGARYFEWVHESVSFLKSVCKC